MKTKKREMKVSKKKNKIVARKKKFQCGKKQAHPFEGVAKLSWLPSRYQMQIKHSH